MTTGEDSSLHEKLKTLAKSDMLPLHMPGHKRASRFTKDFPFYEIDITEIDGFDDLHDPSGVIREMEERFALVYGAHKAWISVNGSTAANEAAILAACKSGSRIIMPRASHKSVYYAVETANLTPVYLQTGISAVTGLVLPPSASEIDAALNENPDAKCVVITSPTYEGLTADVKGIADAVHSHGAILIVDSAHGAHIGIRGDELENEGTLRQGADICILSIHKMLPAPTQTALLLINENAPALNEMSRRIRHYLDVFISSSPSYVLMAGVSGCLEYVEKDAATDLKESRIMLSSFREKCDSLKSFDVSLPEADADPFKIVIRIKNGSCRAKELYDRLLNIYHIQCEMFGPDYVLGLVSTADDEETLRRIFEALKAEDGLLLSGENYDTESGSGSEESSDARSGLCSDESSDAGTDDDGLQKEFATCFAHFPRVRYTPGKAMSFSGTLCEFDEEILGRVCGSYICIYPPGIPLIVPGEVIDEQVLNEYKKALQAGLHITGLTDEKTAVLEDN